MNKTNMVVTRDEEDRGYHIKQTETTETFGDIPVHKEIKIQILKVRRPSVSLENIKGDTK